MIRDFVYGYDESLTPTALEIPLKSPRDFEFIGLSIETFDGSDYQLDLGNDLQFSASSAPYTSSLNFYSFDSSITGSTKIFVKKSNVKSLRLAADAHEFNTSILAPFSRLQNLTLATTASTNIVTIPNNVSTFFATLNTEVTGYSVRRSFTFTPMQRFVLKNEQGTGLTSGEVDNLLEDLSVADWVGIKQVEITGINSARTSASDSFVTTLEGKGVTVTTNP